MGDTNYQVEAITAVIQLKREEKERNTMHLDNQRESELTIKERSKIMPENNSQSSLCYLTKEKLFIFPHQNQATEFIKKFSCLQI